MTRERAHDQRVTGNRRCAADRAETVVRPDLRAVVQVKHVEPAAEGCGVDEAVDHDRRAVHGAV